MTLQKKHKKMEVNFKKPEGMHRELWGLLWTDNRYSNCCAVMIQLHS